MTVSAGPLGFPAAMYVRNEIGSRAYFNSGKYIGAPNFQLVIPANAGNAFQQREALVIL